MNHKFTTKVEIQIDYDSVKPAGFDYESRTSSAIISYNVDIELRDWGIKNLLFLMFDQEITFDVELLPDQDEDSETVAFKLKVKDIEITLPDNFSKGDICPVSLNLEILSLTRLDSGDFSGEATGILDFTSA